MKRHGFTLIELLIVVAIIAILAAIAVPNFLEAQTRSRVSRVHNDLRTIALGMESYRIDNMGYPLSDKMTYLQPHYSSSTLDRRLLTTPISYLSTVAPDVFMLVAGSNTGNYRIYGVCYTASGSTDYGTYPKTAWMTWSYGPDLLTNTGGYFSEKAVMSNEASAAPRIGKDKNGVIIPPATTEYYGGMRYDPTNGTVSYGDIYRFDGEAKSREK